MSRQGATDVLAGALALVAGFAVNDMFKDLINSRFKDVLEEKELAETDETKKIIKIRKRWYYVARIAYVIVILLIVILSIWGIYEISDRMQENMHKAHLTSSKAPNYTDEEQVL